MANYTFVDGVTSVSGFGDRWKVTFGGSWAFSETWTVDIESTQGPLIAGIGNFREALWNQTPTAVATYRNRVYMITADRLLFSETDDPESSLPGPRQWEEQATGAGYLYFLSNYGKQDRLYAISQLQGRLVLFGNMSVQIWNSDADPNGFSLAQVLDNTGTQATLSVQNIGDYDVVYLDSTGFRSLLAKELTLNADMDDIGGPIDLTVQSSIATSGWNSPCGVVEPATKNYWCYLNSVIYVLSRHRRAGFSAWSTYEPKYQVNTTKAPTDTTYDGDGEVAFTGMTVGRTYKWTPGNSTGIACTGSLTLYTTACYFVATATTAYATGQVGSTYTGTLEEITMTTFVPQKFVVYNNVIYARTANGELVSYTGYDTTQVTATLPWLDDKSPGTYKQAEYVDAVWSGSWVMSMGMDPISATYDIVLTNGSAASPSSVDDSTYDIGHIPVTGCGTHFSLKAVSTSTSDQVAKLSSVTFHYNKGER